MKLPKAKLENIVVQNLKDETLIYNLTTNQAYNLNEISARIFNACDGQQTFEDLKAKYRLTDEIIYLALDGLKKRDLIEQDYASPFAGLNRREVVRKVGLASMIALPVISSLVAPSATLAASVSCSCSAPSRSNARTANCPCVGNEDCCGVCITDGGGAGNPICSSPTAAAQPSAAACCPPLR